MNRTLTIDSCSSCPFFDQEYYTYAETCIKLKRVIDKKNNSGNYPIPDDCPLTKTKKKANS